MLHGVHEAYEKVQVVLRSRLCTCLWISLSNTARCTTHHTYISLLLLKGAQPLTNAAAAPHSCSDLIARDHMEGQGLNQRSLFIMKESKGADANGAPAPAARTLRRLYFQQPRGAYEDDLLVDQTYRRTTLTFWLVWETTGVIKHRGAVLPHIADPC